jgi:hypothetical protein
MELAPDPLTEGGCVATFLLLVGCCLCAQTAPPSQSESADSQLAVQVRRFVVQLNDDELARRDAAERDLIRLGPRILSLLPQADAPRLPTEVQSRLERVREKLQRSAGAAVAQPTRVSLSGRLSLADAMASLHEQTGNRVVGFEGRPGWVALDLKDVLYWEALDQVLDQTQLSVNPFGGKPKALVVEARPNGRARRYGQAVYSEAFRFEAVRIESRRNLRDPAADGTRVTLAVSWEPRLDIVSLRQPLDRVVAVGSDGRTLQLGRTGALNVPVDGGLSSVELGIPLARPDRSVDKIVNLKGELTALIPGAVEVFEFSELGDARGVRKRVAGATVTLERWRKNVDVYEARLRVRFDNAGGALESYRGWIYRNEAYLVGPDGKRIEHVGNHPTHQDANEIGLSVLFDLPQGPDGCRLVYTTPAVVLRVHLPYELTDIPLP